MTDNSFSHLSISTPLRVSLLGGGADFSHYISKKARYIFGMAINKYIHFNAYKMPEVVPKTHRFQYSKTEEFSDLNCILHPVIKAVLNYEKPTKFLNVAIASDLPGGSGLGSSSAFTCGLIHLVREVNQHSHNPNLLAYRTIEIEQKILKENVGIQDQLFAALGNVQLFRLLPSHYEQIALGVNLEILFNELECTSFLVFTNLLRSSHKVQEHTSSNFINNNYIEQISNISEVFYDKLFSTNSPIELLAECVNDSWEIKSKFSLGQHFDYINDIIDKTRKGGSRFSKLLGAGHGGFIYCSVPVAKQDNFFKKLEDYIIIKVKPSPYGSICNSYYL